MRKGKTNENKNLFYLEDLKSFFGSFACANETKALQQVSVLPCAKAKLILKLPTSYFYDPLRE